MTQLMKSTGNQGFLFFLLSYGHSLLVLALDTVSTIAHHPAHLVLSPLTSLGLFLQSWFYTAVMVPWMCFFQAYGRTGVVKNQCASITGPDNVSSVAYSLENLLLSVEEASVSTDDPISSSSPSSSPSTNLPSSSSYHHHHHHNQESVNIIGSKLFLALSLLLQDPSHSASYIIERSKSWGLNVRFITNGLAIFHSMEKRIIIVAAGMSVLEMGKSLSTLSRKIDARPFVFGRVLQGPYEELFVRKQKKMETGLSVYETIISDLDELIGGGAAAAAPVNLWLCGAGFSASLTTLLHARWLKVPADLPPLVHWHGSYTFGAPAVGDHDFAMEFASYSNTPLTFAHISPLWRINHRFDLVPWISMTLPAAHGSFLPSEQVGKLFLIDPAILSLANPVLDPWKYSAPAKYFPALVSNLDTCIYLCKRLHHEYVERLLMGERFATQEGFMRFLVPWYLFDSLQSTYYESLILRSQFIKKRH